MNCYFWCGYLSSASVFKLCSDPNLVFQPKAPGFFAVGLVCFLSFGGVLFWVFVGW